MKEKLAPNMDNTSLLNRSRRLRANWEEKRAELRPDPALLRSWRKGVEWDRKGIHLCSTLLALWTFYLVEPVATGGLFLATLAVLGIDHSRLRYRRWALWCYKTFPFVFRVDERHSYSGASVMMIGITVTSALFPASPATAGILCLTWGDSAAALVGQFFQHWRFRRWQKDNPHTPPAVRVRGHKTLAGTLGCLFVCMGMTLLVIGPRWEVVVLAGVVASCMERWTPGRWDNLTIPLVTAGVIHGTLTWWG